MCQVLLKLALLFSRRRWKCEKFTNRRTDWRRTTGDHKSSLELSAQVSLKKIGIKWPKLTPVCHFGIDFVFIDNENIYQKNDLKWLGIRHKQKKWWWTCSLNSIILPTFKNIEKAFHGTVSTKTTQDSSYIKFNVDYTVYTCIVIIFFIYRCSFQSLEDTIMQLLGIHLRHM